MADLQSLLRTDNRRIGGWTDGWTDRWADGYTKYSAHLTFQVVQFNLQFTF